MQEHIQQEITTGVYNYITQLKHVPRRWDGTIF